MSYYVMVCYDMMIYMKWEMNFIIFDEHIFLKDASLRDLDLTQKYRSSSICSTFVPFSNIKWMFFTTFLHGVEGRKKMVELGTSDAYT